MSLPLRARGIEVTIEIAAGAAAMLAHEIDWLLSRVKDEQDKDPQCMLNVEQGTQLWFYLNDLARISICNGAKLSIIPDARTPGCSGYRNHSEPFEGHYIPFKREEESHDEV